MPRTPQGLVMISLRVYQSDVKRLKKYFPDLGYNMAVREIIKRHLDFLDKKSQSAAPSEPELPPFTS